MLLYLVGYQSAKRATQRMNISPRHHLNLLISTGQGKA
ncbi:hypothetical protein GXM_05370 [Nostoc sphaeroides CCNUC1]|uniref:Uncharacterized protein n=1 Tax=Nostoc sphaeroides CCNUC1 TaxID=2653204 RepID=A0A5P8W571_9NOSO|nr:hypothetical protein GXM_05370 [Nostoc sphaeroides CCNUC1]